MTAIEPKDYLKQFEPELNKKLETHLLRREVERVMKEYLTITIAANNESTFNPREFLKEKIK